MSDQVVNRSLNNEGNSMFNGYDEFAGGNFPKEYQRHYKDVLDKRFLIILAITFLVHFSTALYFAINPPNTTVGRADIDRIQRQFARLVLEKPVVEVPIIEETESLPVDKLTSSEGKSSGKGDGSGAQSKKSDSAEENNSGRNNETKVQTVEARKISHSSGAAQRQVSREQISKEVSNKGLLGLLTGSGSAAKGERVADVLGEAAGNQGNLDDILGNLDGLEKSGTAASGSGGSRSKGVKGSRTTGGGGIDDLIQQKEVAKSTDIKRKGQIVLEKVSEIAGENGIKSRSRDADAVSEVIASHNSAIQYCYQRELKSNPDLKGKVVVRFTIHPNGKVSDVQIVSSTMNNSRVERCIISRINRWDDFGSIDPSKGDAVFRQIYTFGY